MTRTLLLNAAAIGLLAYLATRRLTRLETCMSEQYDQLKAAIDERDATQSDAIARIATDVEELKRLADQGAPAEDLRPLIDQVKAGTDQLRTVDPLPDFPAEPEIMEPVEPTS